MKKFIVLLITILMIDSAFAQLRVDAQVRHRFEVRDGFQRLQYEGAIPAIFTAQRTRLSLIHETENLKIRISPQDVRVWGDERIANLTAVHGDSATFDMFEGYVEARIKNNAWVSVGRQQLVYDNEWLLSARNWNHHGNSIDAFVFKAKPKNINVHAGIAWNTFRDRTSNNFFPSDRIKSLNFLWLNRKFTENTQLSLTYLATGVTKNDNSNVIYYRHTSGLFAEHKSENFFIATNGYYQFGVNPQGKNVNAFLGFANVRFITGNFFTGASVSYLSGNSKVGTEMTTDNLFDMLHGARHRYFGFMDYFRFFPNDTEQGGLVDYALTFDYKLSKNLSVRNISHYFLLAQTNSLTGNDARLGFENNFILTNRIKNWGELRLGYCFFLPTETLKNIQNVPDSKFSQFFYLEFTVRSTVFKSEKK